MSTDRAPLDLDAILWMSEDWPEPYPYVVQALVAEVRRLRAEIDALRTLAFDVVTNACATAAGDTAEVSRALINALENILPYAP